MRQLLTCGTIGLHRKRATDVSPPGHTQHLPGPAAPGTAPVPPSLSRRAGGRGGRETWGQGGGARDTSRHPGVPHAASQPALVPVCPQTQRGGSEFPGRKKEKRPVTTAHTRLAAAAAASRDPLPAGRSRPAYHGEAGEQRGGAAGGFQLGAAQVELPPGQRLHRVLVQAHGLRAAGAEGEGMEPSERHTAGTAAPSGGRARAPAALTPHGAQLLPVPGPRLPPRPLRACAPPAAGRLPAAASLGGTA